MKEYTLAKLEILFFCADVIRTSIHTETEETDMPMGGDTSNEVTTGEGTGPDSVVAGPDSEVVE